MPRPDPNDARTANLLGALALAVGDRMLAAVSKPNDRGASVAAALAVIAQEPAASVQALSLALGLSHSATVRVTDRLERDGLVKRKSATGIEDGRRVALELTALGRASAAAQSRRRIEALCEAVGTLSATERRALTALVERLLSALTPDRRTCDHICRLCDLAVCPRANCPVEQAAVAGERGTCSI